MERHDTHEISANTISSDEDHSYIKNKQNQPQKKEQKTTDLKKIQINPKEQIDEKRLKNIKAILDKYKLSPKSKEINNNFKQKAMPQKYTLNNNKIAEFLNLQKQQRKEFIDSTKSDEERLATPGKEIKTITNNLINNNPTVNKNLKNSNSASNINSCTYPLLLGCSYKSSMNQTKYNNILQYEKKLNDINAQKNNEKLLYYKSNSQTGKKFWYFNITKPHRSFITKLYIGETVKDGFYEYKNIKNNKINENNNKINENNKKNENIYISSGDIDIPILFSITNEPYFTTKQIISLNKNNNQSNSKIPKNSIDNLSGTSKIINKFSNSQDKKIKLRRNSVQNIYSSKAPLKNDCFFDKEFHYDRAHNFDAESFSDINDSSSSGNNEEQIKKYRPIKPKKRTNKKKTIKRKPLYQNNKGNAGSSSTNKKGSKKVASQSSISLVSNETKLKKKK